MAHNIAREDRAELYKQVKTMQQIADMAGVSRQAVQQSIEREFSWRHTFNPKTVARCIYPKVKQWMLSEHLTATGLNRRLGYEANNANYARVMRLLEGKAFYKDLVDAVLKESGMTYEEAFGSVI